MWKTANSISAILYSQCTQCILAVDLWNFDLCFSSFPVIKVKSVLVEKYGFSKEGAYSVTQNFLKNFRKCPENPELSLHDWRLLLWKKSLGESHSEISGKIYCLWLNLRYKYLEPPAEVTSFLECLRQNYCLALITNGPSNSQWEKIRRLRLSRYFQLILVSGDLKWEKPCEQIFLEACLFLRVRPEESIMVGDKLETDILGGIRAGLRATVWVSPGESTSELKGRNVMPDCIIEHVTQLEVLLPHKPNFKNCRSETKDAFFAINDVLDRENCTTNSS